ncbi:hypothetical protein Trco_000956 [Trichoderma cornu-damae]|uniref:TATA element modulatory factor 1 TATA binding domain-containing protein n=1 Tax=Trichoderma cornu-damae TaxID=654480 RepID=A0A9P8QT43_9HYPO|nr:hypothetical protein Trco_000956 [Trichoderma cornu-damae]
MAAPGKQSRWGSFLQQAVAGVESRLDTILAESDDDRSAAAAAATTTTASPKVTTSSANSRASSANRANDRLQARLAKAMAGKNAPAAGENRAGASPRSSVDAASRGSMERTSIGQDDDDDGSKGHKPEPASEIESPQTTSDPTTTTTITSTVTATTTPTIITDKGNAGEAAPEPGLERVNDPPSRAQVQQVPEGEPSKEEETTSFQLVRGETSMGDDDATAAAVENGADVSGLARELEDAKTRHREEVQEYVERIDSLQSKLQYLSKSAAESAKKTASSSPAGSPEKKLAERDERIALLMEEGQKLAGAEQKYRATIKALRLQIGERDKQVDEARKARDKAALDAQALRDRLDGDEEKEKRQQEAIKATAALRREIDALRKDNAGKDAAIRRLEQEVKSKEEQGEVAKADAVSKAVAAERVKQRELEEASVAVRAELGALGDKARLEAIEWGEKLERAIQRGSAVESELRLELQSMESKLEGVRVTAEEAASGTAGEAQAKLLRQIETLQSQYASARQNWQGIEASLMSKTTGLERERDEAQRRESEMRRKARDAAKRGRTLEDELQDAQLQLEACREELAALRKSAKATETALEQARADLDKEKRAASRAFAAEAGRQWADEVAVATSRNQSRPESPLLSVPRTFSSEAVGLSVPSRMRRSPTPISIGDNAAEGLGVLRRPPTHLPTRTGTGSMSIAGSIPPPSPFSPLDPPMGSPPALPPPSVTERENGVSDTAPSSPRNLAQDMISVSTVAAGPSVQLVERMSAAIRRLEAERVAAKEEMARVCSQRDEARGDMVSLMKELEEAKAASARVPELEKEVADLDTRYQTTLELLGEKSELVDELRADVDDVKSMYRELVERTVK